MTPQNYQIAFLKFNFHINLLNSLVVACSSTLIAVMVGSLAAYGLARFKFLGGYQLLLLILTARMLPAISIIIPLYDLMKAANLIDTQAGLVIAHTAFNLPFAVWLLRGFFAGIPREFEEAARIDGCSRIRSLLVIVFPIAGAGLAATAILCFLNSWNEFLSAMVITSTLASKTASVGIADYITSYKILWGPMCAAGVIYTFPVLVFSSYVQKYLTRTAMMGAVKM
jgi:multiple sugar transport system permease protein